MIPWWTLLIVIPAAFALSLDFVVRAWASTMAKKEERGMVVLKMCNGKWDRQAERVWHESTSCPVHGTISHA